MSGVASNFEAPLELTFPQGSARPADIVERLSRMRYEPLVPSSAWRALAEMAEDVPVPVHTLFVESRLHGSVERADFGVGVFPGPEIARWSGRVLERGELGPEWRRVAMFLEAWASPSSPGHGEVPFIFLAFDRDDGATVRAAPCISLCIDPHLFARNHGADAAPLPSVEGTLELARRSYRALTGAELSRAACERLLLLATGDGVELRHISVMVPRPSAPTKLDLRLPLSRLSDYLERQKWPDASAIAARMRELVPFDGSVQLNLPLEPYPARRLEIEVFAGRVQATRAERFRFLERLVELGLVASEKAHVLEAIHERPLVDLAPGKVLGANFYVKLGFEEGEPREAKAYVGWMPRLLPNLMRPPFQE